MSTENSENNKKQKLVVSFTIAITLVFVILNTIQVKIATSNVQKSTTAEYEQSINQIVSSNANAFSNEIYGYILEMKMYTETNTAQTGDIEQMHKWIVAHRQTRSNHFDYILVCGPDGNYVTDLDKTGNILDRPYYKAIFEQGKDYYVDDPVFSKNTGKAVIHIARAVKVNGKPVALFAGVASINKIQEEVQKMKLGEKGYGWLLASNGTVISHPVEEYEMKKNFITDLTEKNKDMSEVAKSIAAGKKGSAWVNGLNESKDLISYYPVEYTPWGLAFSVPDSQIKQTSNSLRTKMIITGLIIGFMIIFFAAMLIIYSLKPLQIVQKTIYGIASGNADLTKRIEIKSNNEIGGVVDGFNKFTEKLQNIVRDIIISKNDLSKAGTSLQETSQDTASVMIQIQSNIDSVHTQIVNQSASVEETAGAVNQIAANISSLEKMIETESSGVVQASAAVEEMIGNINSVDQVVNHMAQSFEELQSKANTGSAKQKDVNEKIEQIKQQSETLGDANKSIQNIASQTNLLAMNAAIEAAHAGEAGKGFSVVADEIRKLSETSSMQSKTIGEQLKKIQQSISDVVGASSESSSAFNSVSGMIKDTDELVRQISGAMVEQKEGSKQITDALHSMNDNTVEVKNASTEMGQGNKAILEEVKRLQDITYAVKDSMDEMKIGADKVNKASVALSEISTKMENSISRIGKQIDEFTV